jgi:8-oxo-dGTP pyrophosphatase MutT (NUDIX family)
MQEKAQPEAAVAIVCARGESILLIRRSQRADDPWSGHWSFPGGRRDPEDTDLLQTALRELEEECGIRLRREHNERALPHSLARRRSGPFVLVAPFVFGVERELATVLDEREAVESVWIRKQRLREPSHHRLSVVPGRPENLLFPAVDLNGMPLWGFTYRLVTEWLELLPEQNLLEPAGFEAASVVLDAVLAEGLKLEEPWHAGGDGVQATGGVYRNDSRRTVKCSVVRGVIPVAQVVARLSRAGTQVPRVNAVEVRPDGVRVTGLAFEEYVIRARE